MSAMVFSFATALAVSSAGWTAASLTPRACIRVERGNGGSPVIMARVNDSGPFAFVLDTGSSGTTLDAERIRELRLQPTATTEQGQGMGGAIDVRLYRLSSFRTGPISINGMTVPGITAPVLPGHDIAGLAGVDIFGRHLATWRWDRACVEVGRSGQRPSGRAWHRVRSRWLQPWKVLVPVQIGSANGWGLLDTGAQKSVLSPGFSRAAALDETHHASSSAITGIDGNKTALTQHRVSATVGSWSFDNVRVSVAALPLFDRLGGLNEAVAVIGMDLIRSNQFAIDYGSQQVWQKASKQSEP